VVGRWLCCFLCGLRAESNLSVPRHPKQQVSEMSRLAREAVDSRIPARSLPPRVVPAEGDTQHAAHGGPLRPHGNFNEFVARTHADSKSDWSRGRTRTRSSRGAESGSVAARALVGPGFRRGTGHIGWSASAGRRGACLFGWEADLFGRDAGLPGGLPGRGVGRFGRTARLALPRSRLAGRLIWSARERSREKRT